MPTREGWLWHAARKHGSWSSIRTPLAAGRAVKGFEGAVAARGVVRRLDDDAKVVLPEPACLVIDS